MDIPSLTTPLAPKTATVMGPMTVAVFGAKGVVNDGISIVVAGRYAPGEFLVCGSDAGIDHIDMHVLPRFYELRPPLEREQPVVGAIEAPGHRGREGGRLTLDRSRGRRTNVCLDALDIV